MRSKPIAAHQGAKVTNPDTDQDATAARKWKAHPIVCVLIEHMLTSGRRLSALAEANDEAIWPAAERLLAARMGAPSVGQIISTTQNPAVVPRWYQRPSRPRSGLPVGRMRRLLSVPCPCPRKSDDTGVMPQERPDEVLGDLPTGRLSAMLADGNCARISSRCAKWTSP